MNNINILKKVIEKEKILKNITDITALAQLAQTLSFINFALKYKYVKKNIDLDIAKKLELTEVEKYWKYISKVEIKLD